MTTPWSVFSYLLHQRHFIRILTPEFGVFLEYSSAIKPVLAQVTMKGTQIDQGFKTKC